MRTLNKKTVCFCVFNSILLMTAIATISLLFPVGINARAQEIERDFSSVEAKIDSIDLSNINELSDTSLLYEEAKELAAVGIGSVPLLMERIEDEDLDGQRRAFYIRGLYNLLAIDRMDILLDPEYFDLSAPGHPEYAGIKKLIVQSRTAIPEILASSWTNEEKVEALSKFGVLSVPYINEYIDSGEREYISYFTRAGLQYTPEQRIDMMNSESKVSSDAVLDGSAAESVVGFDYAEWNDANKYDLEILSNYISEMDIE